MASLPNRRYTPDEYLAIERAADFKSEYISGEMFALAGASYSHGIIVANLTFELKRALRGRPCDVIGGDLRVRTTNTSYLYPDLVTICGEPQFVDSQFDTLLNPGLVFEVLSKSTESYDRGEKFFLYRQLESLNSYILISQDKPRAEWYVKQPDGHWLFEEANGLDSHISLPFIDCKIALADIYDRVNFGDKIAG